MLDERRDPEREQADPQEAERDHATVHHLFDDPKAQPLLEARH